MMRNQENGVRREEFDPLAAELAKIPAERLQQVRRDAAIFIAGILAAEQPVQGIRPTA